MKFFFVYLLSFFTCLLFAGFAHAQITMSPKYHQFGRVSPGKKYQIKVTIKNPTDQTISLWNIQTDCECTTATIAKAVLKPKTSTTMIVDYHPNTGENGFKSLSVNFQVYSQDKQKGIQRNNEKFMFTAEVHSPYTFAPVTLDAGETLFGREKEAKGTLKLDADPYGKWKPGTAESSVNGLKTVLMASKTPGVYDISLTVPATQQPGDYKGNIKITGKTSKDAVFQYPFHAIVGSIWNVDPKFIHVGPLDPEKFDKWRFETQIRNVYGKKFKILKVVDLPKWLSYSEDHNKAGDFLLRWKVNKDELKKAHNSSLSPVVKIQTDSKEESDINLVLDAYWPAPTATPMPKVVFTPTAVVKTKGK